MENSEIRILIVDDEPDIIEFVSFNLKQEGFQVFGATDGSIAIEKAKTILPHLIILDVMMPKLDGIETCSELRKIDELKKTIIVFLSVRNEDFTLIAGYEAGADDYITKPIKPRLLVTKIKTLLKRLSQDEEPESTNIIITDEFAIDKEKRMVTKNNVLIDLTKREFEILLLLVSRPNRVFTREEIYQKIWGQDVVVGDRTIDVHIRHLREKLTTEKIKTLVGVGYKYEIGSY